MVTVVGQSVGAGDKKQATYYVKKMMLWSYLLLGIVNTLIILFADQLIGLYRSLTPETVALAYDKTVLKCHELKWPYCNGILKRWHQAGLHTVAEIEERDRPAPKPAAGDDNNAWMKKYIQQRKEV